MKNQITLDDYRLKIETDEMIVFIQLRKHKQVKEIIGMTKDLVELATKKPAKTILPQPDHPSGAFIEKKAVDFTCLICKKPFTPKRKDSKYCSKPCQQKAYSKTFHEKNKAKNNTRRGEQIDKRPTKKEILENNLNPLIGRGKKED